MKTFTSQGMTAKLFVLFFSFFLFQYLAVNAQCRFTSNANGNWTNAAIWTVTPGNCGRTLPGPDDDVVINHQVALNTSVTVANLTISSSNSSTRSLTLSGGVFTMTVTGDLNTGNRSIITITDGATLTVNGDWNSGNNGNVNVQGEAPLKDGNFLVKGCYKIGNAQPTNVVDGTYLNWCISCNGANNSSSEQGVCARLLPVKLISFSASLSLDPTRVKVEWTTASETQNDYFVVERSSDGYKFSEVARIDGAGTTRNINRYEVTDEMPMPGLSYYRLRQTDFDGTTTYGRTVMVNAPVQQQQLVLSPNPSHSDAPEVVIDKLAQSVEPVIHIYDHLGRLLSPDAYATGTTEDRRFAIHFRQHLNSGIYFVRVTQGSETQVLKWMVE